MYQKQKTDSMRTWQTYLFEKIEVYTVSLFLSDKEITLFKSSRDSCNIHGDRHLGFNYFVVLCKEQNDVYLMDVVAMPLRIRTYFFRLYWLCCTNLTLFSSFQKIFLHAYAGRPFLKIILSSNIRHIRQ